MKKATFLFVSVLVISFFSFISQAALIQVPGEQATIQAGIDAAFEEDTVLVADGTYIGSGNKDLDYGGKAIVVLSENGPNLTVINCMTDGRGITFDDGETSEAVFDGFSIKNGWEQDGGGIYCYESSPTIQNCILLYSNLDGFYIQFSSPSILNCIVSESHEHGLKSYDSSPIITDCTFTKNSSNGIYCNDSYPILIGCSISQNGPAYYGGGIKCQHSPAFLTDCTIDGNSVSGAGGGIWCSSGSSLTITNCTISENESNYGGAIDSGAELLVSNCLIMNNHGGKGGGINTIAGSISDCTFSGNIASYGGGVYCQGSSQSIVNCNFLVTFKRYRLAESQRPRCQL